jgi:hypothetical protein
VIAAIQSRVRPGRVIQDTPMMKPGLMVKADPFCDFMVVFEKNLPGRPRVQILFTRVTYSARIDVSGSDQEVLARPEISKR